MTYEELKYKLNEILIEADYNRYDETSATILATIHEALKEPTDRMRDAVPFQEAEFGWPIMLELSALKEIKP